MASPSGRRLALAFAASLAAHLVLLIGPRYRLALEQDEPASSLRLEARLAMPAPEAVEHAPSLPRPKPAARPATSHAPAAASGVAEARLPPQAASPNAVPVPATTPAAGAEAGGQAGDVAGKEGQGKEAGQASTPAASSPPPSATLAPFSDMLASASHGSISFQVMLGRQGLVVGRMTHSWTREEGRYTLESVTETVGLAALFRRIQLVQQSSGRMTGAGLVPDEFRVIQDEGGGDVTRYGSRFDWQAMRVSLVKDNEKKDLPLDAGAQDLLSFIYQLVLHPPVGRSALRISTGKAYNNYELDYRGDEKLPSPVGAVMARHYATLGPPGEQSTEIWLAPELGYLPVKVRFIDKKGTVADAMIQNVDFGSVQRQEIQRIPGLQ